MGVPRPLGRVSVSSFSPSPLGWKKRVRLPRGFLGVQLSSFFDPLLRSAAGFRRGLGMYPLPSSYPCVLTDELSHSSRRRMERIPFTFFSTLCMFSGPESELAMVRGNVAETRGVLRRGSKRVNGNQHAAFNAAITWEILD